MAVHPRAGGVGGLSCLPMAVIRCRECRSWLARLTGRVKVVATIPDDRYAAEGNDVVRCGSCGTVHEVERSEEAA